MESQLEFDLKFLFKNFKGLTFQKVNHLITAVDSQVTVEQGILINVIGQLKVMA